MHALLSLISRFWVVLGYLRTLKSMLPCTREHDFRKIAVFAPGSDFRWFLVDFSSLLAPKTLQNDLPKRLQKSMQIFIELLSIFGSILDPVWDPKIWKNSQKIYWNQKLSFSGAWKGPRHHFGAILAHLGMIFSQFWVDFCSFSVFSLFFLAESWQKLQNQAILPHTYWATPTHEILLRCGGLASAS